MHSKEPLIPNLFRTFAQKGRNSHLSYYPMRQDNVFYNSRQSGCQIFLKMKVSIYPLFIVKILTVSFYKKDRPNRCRGSLNTNPNVL